MTDATIPSLLRLPPGPVDLTAIDTDAAPGFDGGKDDGEAALRRCLALVPASSEPSHAMVWYRLGLIAEHRGDLNAARAAFAKALELEPNFTRPAEALKRLGRAG